MKRTLIGLLLCLCVFGCSSFHYKQKDIIGTYEKIWTNGSKSGINLYFNKLGFALVDNNKYRESAPYLCCDTITYGDWEVDNKYGVISLSTPQLSDSYSMNIIEEEHKAKSDSIIFLITNPVERIIKNKHGIINYNIFLNVTTPFNISNVGRSLYDIEVAVEGKLFDSNRIAIANPNHAIIKSFTIYVYPKDDYNGRNIAVKTLYSPEYKVKYKESNVFKIDMPNITLGYITYLRLNQHLLKIISKDEIIWDGNKYKRK